MEGGGRTADGAGVHGDERGASPATLTPYPAPAGGRHALRTGPPDGTATTESNGSTATTDSAKSATSTGSTTGTASTNSTAGAEPAPSGTGRHAVVVPVGADDLTELIPRQDSGRHHLFLPDGRPPRHRRPVPPPTALAAALGALVGAGVMVVVGREMVDDAYITLTYARTLGLHGGWGMYPGLTANTATSPLDVLLLGGLTAVVRDAVVAAGVLLALTYAAAGAWLCRIGTLLRVPAWRAPVLGLALLGTSPLMLSTVGLESALAVTWMIGLAERVLARAPVTAGVLAGLLVLTRPDLAVVALVGVALCGRGWWRATLGAAVVVLPWCAWSWSVLGSAVPDTLLVKAGTHWGPWTFANGPALWWTKFPTATALVAVPVVAGLVALPFWLARPRLRPAGAALGLGAVGHAGVMCALGVPPFHWYYAPSALALGLLAVLSAALVPAGRIAGATVATVVTAVAVTAAVTTAVSGAPALTSNWATADQYQRIAAQLPAGATIESPGEVGTLAYYCRCRILDGLADRGSISALLQKRLAVATGLGGTLLRLNYQNYVPTRPVPRDLRMTTRVVRDPDAPMVTGWGPPRQWGLVGVPRPARIPG